MNTGAPTDQSSPFQAARGHGGTAGSVKPLGASPQRGGLAAPHPFKNISLQYFSLLFFSDFLYFSFINLRLRRVSLFYRPVPKRLNRANSQVLMYFPVVQSCVRMMEPDNSISPTARFCMTMRCVSTEFCRRFKNQS